MKAYTLVLLLLSAFSGVLLWRILDRPDAVVPPPLPKEKPPAAAPLRGPKPLLKTLLAREAVDGTRHALLTRSSNQGLYYRRGEQEAALIDTGVAVGESLDLATDGAERVYVAYFEKETGEVRFAVPGRTPQAWCALRALEQPILLTLSVTPGGALLSYYDEATETLYYSFWEVDKDTWLHGTIGQGGAYRVVRGRPGDFVFSN